MSSFCGNKECLDRHYHLPPPSVSEKFRQYEQLGLRVRSFTGLGIHDRLDPFFLAEKLGLRVVPLDLIEGLSEELKAKLQSNQSWSGGATPTLPDGTRVVILNPQQSAERKAATLMEEICHTLLGHKHSEISVNQTSGNHRSYDRQVEDEAYSVGAAALLPYRALACDLSRKQTIRSIAARAGVSQSLVKYRIKVLKLTGNI